MIAYHLNVRGTQTLLPQFSRKLREGTVVRDSLWQRLLRRGKMQEHRRLGGWGEMEPTKQQRGSQVKDESFGTQLKMWKQAKSQRELRLHD